MWRGISLANKSLLLFGAAVVLIILAALTVPLIRLIRVVDETQRQLSSDLVSVWQFGLDSDLRVGPTLPPARSSRVGEASIELLTTEALSQRAADDPFVLDAKARFQRDPAANDLHLAQWQGLSREYRYARAVRDAEQNLIAVVLLSRVSEVAWQQTKINILYLGSAGLVALGLACGLFYLITSKIILSPVRDLRATADKVREGDLAIRSAIKTGDEFEELSDTFNQMLVNIRTSQDQLRAINVALDVKVKELDERNLALFEANKLKGDFLASVSHELRTPLNSIVGFADLLVEQCDREEGLLAAGAAQVSAEDAARLAKRKRYVENIAKSSRSLLDMINGLLDMAKAEAGKIDLAIADTSVRDLCETLMALIRPVADRGGVELILDLAPDLPVIRTDPKKLQQIVFNLLSNAVKFTSEKVVDQRALASPPPPSSPLSPNGSADGPAFVPSPSSSTPVGRVTLRAERLVGRGSEGQAAEDRVRISVLDTGPGISPEDQKKIFQKFQQLDTGHTRRHAGTGLGLAISKELTALLKGDIMVESDVGRGSMFSVILPLAIEPVTAPGAGQPAPSQSAPAQPVAATA